MNILFEEDAHAALPDLVLLDWKLPGLSGNDVLLRLRAHQDLRKIPVLVFSTSGEDEDVHSAYRAHANGYIKKPSDADALNTVVESIEQFWTAVATLAIVTR
jgi:CheY-like chemotaxis protein